jgi:hypothetical protein
MSEDDKSNDSAETDAELLGRLGTDGQAWACEFLAKFDGETVGGERVDEGLLLAWFANAIEAGRTAGEREPRVEGTDGADVRV